MMPVPSVGCPGAGWARAVPAQAFITRFLLTASSPHCCRAAPLHLGQAEGFASPPDFHHTLGVWAITATRHTPCLL